MIPHLAPTKAWLDSFGTNLTEFPQLPSKDHLDFNSQGEIREKIVDCLIKAVNFASVLAFINWGVRFRAMSMRYLQTAWDFTKPHSLLSKDLIYHMLTEGGVTSFDMKDLISYALELVTDTRF